jgi:hypothetical protein
MRILLVAYEFESSIIAKVASKLQGVGHEIRIIQADPTTVLKLPQILQPYHELDIIQCVNTLNSCLDKLSSNPVKPDWKYLKRFEKKYCINKNLIQLGMTDPMLFSHHHYRRPYYCGWKNDWLQFSMIECLLRWLEGIFDEFSPDLIFSIDRNYFIKNAAVVIAEKKECHVVSLFAGRVGNYWGINRVAGFPHEDPNYNEFIRRSDYALDLSGARKNVESMVLQNEGLYQSHSRIKIQQKKLITVPAAINSLLGSLIRVTKNVINRKVYSKESISLNNGCEIMTSSTIKVYIYYFRIAINQMRYVLQKPFKTEIPESDFLLFPLHTIPESSTMTYSTEYYESDLIRFISKELPANMYLVVKENANMIGERFWKFYKDIQCLPNVIMLDPMVPTGTVIQSSKGVVGITGTALLESTLMGIPTHCFGMPEFLPAINSCGYGDFPHFAVGCQEGTVSAKKGIAMMHVQYILDNGVSIDLNSIRKPGQANSNKTLENITNLLLDEIKECNNIKYPSLDGADK